METTLYPHMNVKTMNWSIFQFKLFVEWYKFVIDQFVLTYKIRALFKQLPKHLYSMNGEVNGIVKKFSHKPQGKLG